MKWRKRKKLEDKKRKIEWRVWKRGVVVSLQSYIQLALELCNFLV